MRSSSHIVAATILVVAVVVAVPTAGRSEASKVRKPVGQLEIAAHDVFVRGKAIDYGKPRLYPGDGVRTGESGQAFVTLDVKNAGCTVGKRTRVLVRPAPAVLLRVASVPADVFCAWGGGKGQAVLEGPNAKGYRTTVTSKDPLVGFVVTKQNVVVKVSRGSVVITGRSGRDRAVVLGRARQALVRLGGDPRQPRPIAVTPGERRVLSRLDGLLPPTRDNAPPRVELRNVPGQTTDEILARLAFTTAGKEDRSDVTYACSFDGGGFFVCSPPVRKAFGTGRHVFSVRAVDAAGNVGNPVTADWRVVRPREGWIVFQSKRDGNWELYAMNSDGSGEARLTNNTAVDVDAAWSPKGDEIVFESDRLTGHGSDIWVMDIADTRARPLIRERANERNPKWSPRGDRIAFESDRDGDYEIYVMDDHGKNMKQLTFNGARDSEPSWSPDGKRIVFESDRDGPSELYVIDVDEKGEPTRLKSNVSPLFNPAWSPDGKTIAFNSNRGGNEDIYVISAEGGSATRLTTDPAADSDPAWARTGKKVAFSSHRGGTTEIWVMDADGNGQEQLTRSAADSLVPNW
jgi:TolB protein